MAKFGIVLVCSLVVVVLASLWWPKFSREPRPKTLQEVHDLVIKTKLGQEATDVLGVEVDSASPSANLAATVASISATVVSGIGQKVEEAVTSQASIIFLTQYQKLPPPAREELKQTICKP